MNQKNLKQIINLKSVNRMQLVKVYGYTHRSYMKKTTHETGQKLAIWTNRLNTLKDARETLKEIMRALNLKTVEKDNYGDSSLILRGKINNLNIDIWIEIKRENALYILSEYFNCTITRQTVHHKAYTKESIACAVKQ